MLYDFPGSNGDAPSGNMIQGTDGFLYGLGSHGGTIGSSCYGNDGVLFRCSLTGEDTTIVNFDGTDGQEPGGSP